MVGTDDCRVGKSLDAKIIAPALLFVFLTVKIYGVAGFSLTTAAGLITTAPLSVLTGIIVLYAYAFMAFLVVLFLWLFILGIRGNNYYCRRFAGLIFTVMIFTALLSPWHYLLDSLACVALALLLASLISAPYKALDMIIHPSKVWNLVRNAAKELMSKLRKHGDLITHPGKVKRLIEDGTQKPRSEHGEFRPENIPLSRLAMITLTIVVAELMVFVLATIGKPWVPAEVVVLNSPVAANPTKPEKSQTRKPVVFILSETSGRVTMLIDEDRYLVSVPENFIQHRMICHQDDQFSGANPLLETIFGQPYQTHNLSCWRCTDQSVEQQKQVPPLIIQIIQWDINPTRETGKQSCKALNASSG